MQPDALTRLVDEVRDLPLTVSDVLAQVITECDNADASVSSLARIMAADQALAAMVLKLANSAYYGYARRIESLPDAVVLLGFASVKNLAITASITRLLAVDQDDLSDVRGQIFDHSLSTAVCTRLIGRTRRISGEKAFVGGLLHDLGVIVLVCYAKDDFRALHSRALREQRTLEELEVDELGFTHAELGAQIAAEWQFPPALCDALRHHHDPSGAEVDLPLAQAVHLGDFLARRLGHTITGMPPSTAPDPTAAQAFGLTPESLPRFKQEAEAEFSEGESLRSLGRAA
jgi:putative nucleotidyltransferase with HDIG domain